MFVSGNRVYVADSQNGLIIFCTIPQLQYMMRVDGGTAGMPFTIEAASNLNSPISWTPILTTNPPVVPFEFTDFDVVGPVKFYRARQQ